MKPRARVLFVGRDAADASLLELVLSGEHAGVEVVHVGDPVTFGREVERADFDLVVCDERLDWGLATSVVLEVRSRRPEASVVVLAEEEPATPSGPSERRRETVLRKSSHAFLALPDLLAEALERARLESSASKIEPRVAGLLERSLIGVFRLTLDGRLVEADETFLRIVGARSLEEAQSLDLADLTPRLPRGFTEGGKVYKREQRLEGVDGEEVHLAVTVVVSLDEAGLPVLDGLVEDARSRQAEAEDLSVEATRLARSNEDLAMFASLAAHELKEPLRTIEQSTRFVIEDVGDDLGDESGESARLIIESVRRLQSMIEGLLTLARFGGGEEWVEACDCNEAVEEVLDSLKARIEESGAKIKVRPLPTVRADPMQLRLLFRNLISNAIRFHGDAPPRIRVAARQDEEQWVFSVEDEGIGIESSEAERIFERFARASTGPGAGLGLAICRQVVERHGGRIWVESEPGRGSTFYFTIPLSGSGQTESRDEPKDDGDRRGAKREAG